MTLQTHPVSISTCTLGGSHPCAVQSMCNTNTLDIDASVAQCRALAHAGAQLIRLTTQGLAQVEALGQIQQRLRAQGITVPLVADVHFSAQVAFAAAQTVQKVRINPGNFSKDHAKALELLRELIALCRTHGTALRIGVNHGSLSERIIAQYGNTPEGMCQAAMEYLHVCQDEGFDRVVVSLKSSNTRVMTQAYRLLAARMEQAHMGYPLHLGVTESGNGLQGRLKSAAGIATLLSLGLGNTLRVSLTEDPVQEILFGHLIAQYAATHPMGRSNHHPPTHYHVPSMDHLIVAACFDWAPSLLLQTRKAEDLPVFTATIDGTPVASATMEDFRLELLQATRCLFTKPEYISCPGCGRTLYDLEGTLARVKAATQHLKGITIAVMGCIVNGPGEMADAHFGYVGSGPGTVTLYKGRTPVRQHVPQDQAVEQLLKLIEESNITAS